VFKWGRCDLQKTIFLSLEQMKILSDKNKINILNCFENETPLTITEISEFLDLAYANINYHVKVLEKLGIVEVVDTKIKSGIIEKYYLPSAEEFRVDKFITMFEDDEEKKALKNEYNSLYEEFVKDYQNLKESIHMDNQKDAIFLNSIIFLDKKASEAIKEDINNFVTSIERKYSKKTEGAIAYSIGNLLIPTKDKYHMKNIDSDEGLEEQAT
jgi:DNA-binding transcriptional ArsR family regulator